MGIPNKNDTRFRLASTSKLFTAIAIMQLVEDGKLSLTDTVGDIIPDYANETVRTKVTLLHLLKMTSGLGDIFGYEADFSTFQNHQDYVVLFEKEPPAFEPGSQFLYSNAGYTLLGRIVEIASGRDFYSYIEDEVFRTANMPTVSYLYRNDGNQTPDALSYRVEGIAEMAETIEQVRDGHLVPDLSLLSARGTSAGGGYATVYDFVHLDKALRNGSLISDASLAVVFSQAYVDGLKPGGIMGGAPGVSTRYRLLPNGYSIIIFGNIDQPTAIEIAEQYYEVVK